MDEGEVVVRGENLHQKAANSERSMHVTCVTCLPPLSSTIPAAPRPLSSSRLLVEPFPAIDHEDGSRHPVAGGRGEKGDRVRDVARRSPAAERNGALSVVSHCPLHSEHVDGALIRWSERLL